MNLIDLWNQQSKHELRIDHAPSTTSRASQHTKTGVDAVVLIVVVINQ